MFPGRRIRYEYYRIRNIAVKNALRTQPLDITGNLKSIVKTLKAGNQIAAAVDVPAYLSAANQAIPFLGRKARLPRGLFRLAVAQKVPVTVFVNGFNFQTGRRNLRIYEIGVRNNVEELMLDVYQHLEQLIEEEPSAWHFWRISEAFFDMRA
jgi:lauroyl/myristoyl acyltransferase